MFTNNIILNSDSYKYSMHVQYPPGTTHVFSYIESRGGEHEETQFFGLQAFIKQYLLKPITAENIAEAKEIIEAHGEPFNEEGWNYILKEHNGYLPVEIKAVPEGMVIPTRNVLATIVNTDPKCYWLTTFLETALLRAIWYPTTVATVSYQIKRIIDAYLHMTGDRNLLPFKLHDFGARGVSSAESAELGGMAHLVNFMGTDNVNALVAARRYYNQPMAGFSIPAMEHSTVTSWGRHSEADAYRNMIENYGGEGKLYAAVSDSYDIFNAVDNIWGKQLKDLVISKGGTVVVRPDSGDPADVVVKVVKKLWDAFGGTTNSEGYKVLNPAVRVIQGDGVNLKSIHEILIALRLHHFSADNVAFGMGGALLQHMNRDTQKFALKCSSVQVNGTWQDVFKDPVTDQGKRSKAGRLTLVRDTEKGGYHTVRVDQVKILGGYEEVLRPVFVDGKLLIDETLDQIRERAKIP